jgi:CheY-like chemotaxis protein
MDINLPEVTGLGALWRLKSVAELASTPIVATTANVIYGGRAYYLKMGFDDYLPKPVDPQQLLDIIQRLIHPHDAHEW